jgi:hypothetical protein
MPEKLGQVDYCLLTWCLREQKHTIDGLWPGNPPWPPSQTAGQGSFQAKDHHECVSAPSEITLVWFYIYSMPPKTTEKLLLIMEFHTPSSPRCRDDVTPMGPRHHVDLSNNTHDVIEDPRQHWRNRGNPYYTCVVSDIFIPRLDLQTPRVKFCYLFTKCIELVIVHAVR